MERCVKEQRPSPIRARRRIAEEEADDAPGDEWATPQATGPAAASPAPIGWPRHTGKSCPTWDEL